MKPDNRKEKEILDRLSAGLSEEEIRRVLAGALSAIGSKGLGDLAAKLGPETGEALLRSLQSSPKGAPQNPGPAKVLQEWKKAWKDWDGIICEACDENGKYVLQEHHWEQPFFDPLSVTGDLEPIAARMAALLPRVFDEDLDPDFSFAEAVADSVDEIGSSLPDWMGPFDNEGFELGPNATHCLIEWELRACRSEGKGPFHLIDKLRELEESDPGLGLDGEALASFVRGLGKDAKREVLDGIRAKKDEDRWRKVLNSAHSRWFLIYKDLCRSQDRSGYFETCRARIGQDWSLAVPVIKDLVRKKANEEIVLVCAEAAASFLDIRDGKGWDPRETLIASRGDGPSDDKTDEKFIFLLTAWMQATSALGREDTAEAIRLQSALFSEWRDWDKALDAFSRVPSPALDAMRDKLFDQWRSLVTKESGDRFVFGWDRFDDRENPRGHRSWVSALVDAAREGQTGATGFKEGIRGFLKGIEADRNSLRRGLNELALISQDIKSGDWIKALSPTLSRLLGYGWTKDKALLASRRLWLDRLGTASLVPELQAFWKRNLLRLIPDPASYTGSNYQQCVDWVQALWEVDQDGAKRLLGEWGAVHRRRRNLWDAVRERGLPVPEFHGRKL